MPGVTLAANKTRRPERVLPPWGGGGDTHFHFANYVGSKQDLITAIRQAAAQFQRRNGGRRSGPNRAHTPETGLGEESAAPAPDARDLQADQPLHATPRH
jgi:hypothetical protein